MRIFSLMLILSILIYCYECTAQPADIALYQPENNFRLYDLAKKRLNDLWTWTQSTLNGSKDNFIGRCFGVARKLQLALPLILVKLGVIVTTLVFLSIFALKSLALLVLLVLFHTSNIAAKFAVGTSEHKPSHPPQNVHFHIHQNKGQYQIPHSGSSSLWNRNDLDSYSGDNSLSGEEEINTKLKMFNTFKQLGINPYETDSLNNIHYS